MRRELGIERAIRARGGLARTSELIAAGYYTELIRVFHDYGVIVDAGHGWWATRDVPPAVIIARRNGGKLACISALAHLGAAADGTDGTNGTNGTNGANGTSGASGTDGVRSVGERDGDERIHILLPRSARSPKERGLIVHWSRNSLPGDRQSVNPRIAHTQARGCRVANGTLEE